MPPQTTGPFPPFGRDMAFFKENVTYLYTLKSLHFKSTSRLSDHAEQRNVLTITNYIKASFPSTRLCSQDDKVLSTISTVRPSNLKTVRQCSIFTPSFHAIKYFRWQPHLKPVT